jgi:hypothetical protein
MIHVKNLVTFLTGAVDSHEIFSPDFLGELEAFGVSYASDTHKLSGDGREVVAAVYTREALQAQADARPGTILAPSCEQGICGADILAAVCKLILDEDPGTMFHGLGFATRARKEALEKFAAVWAVKESAPPGQSQKG